MNWDTDHDSGISYIASRTEPTIRSLGRNANDYLPEMLRAFQVLESFNRLLEPKDAVHVRVDLVKLGELQQLFKLLLRADANTPSMESDGVSHDGLASTHRNVACLKRARRGTLGVAVWGPPRKPIV